MDTRMRSSRAINLLEHLLKIVERVLEMRIRSQMQVDEMQFGFRLYARKRNHGYHFQCTANEGETHGQEEEELYAICV